MKTMTEISKLIAMVLRHKPEELQLTLDEHGWCDAGQIVGKRHGKPVVLVVDEARMAKDGSILSTACGSWGLCRRRT